MKKQNIFPFSIFVISLFLVDLSYGGLPVYEITDLGTLGGDSSSSRAINNLGQVVGISGLSSGTSHAFLWDSTDGMIDLGMLPRPYGGGYSRANGINDNTQVVGYSGSDDGSAFIWDSNKGIHYLDGIGNSESTAYSINSSGQVVGRVYGYPGFGFIWEDGVVIDLSFYPWTINNRGQVVGHFGDYTTRHAVLWDEASGMCDLGTLGGSYSEAFAINDAGQIVGFSEDIFGDRQAFIWDAAYNMIALGQGIPRAINNAGQVVGSLTSSGTAFYWDSETGIVRLDELLPSGFGWAKLEIARGINNHGQIVGSGLRTGSTAPRAFLMSPVLPTIEVPMKITPRSLNCYSKGKWIKAHLVLPAEFTVEDVNSNSIATVHPLGIEPNHVDIFVNEDSLVEIEAAFGRAYLCSVLRDSWFSEITITVRGSFTNGQYFYGTDTIRIIDNICKYLALLSSHWLDVNCSEPDWCDGTDIDQDFSVNFNDFAFMAYHWLENNNP